MMVMWSPRSALGTMSDTVAFEGRTAPGGQLSDGGVRAVTERY